MAVLPVWGYNVTNSRVINMDNAYTYARQVGERFAHQPNIVWVNGGDRPALGFEDVFRELAHGLRAGDSGAHLITYHPCGWQSSSYYFPCDDWLDFNMIETWTDWFFETGNDLSARVFPLRVRQAFTTPDYWQDAILILDGIAE